MVVSRFSLASVGLLVALLFLLSWAFDEVYQHIQAANQTTLIEQQAEQLVPLILAAEQHTSVAPYVATLSEKAEFDADIMPLQRASLPAPLTQQLHTHGSLLLETSSGYSLYIALVNEQSVVRLNFAKAATNDSGVELVLTVSFYLGFAIILLLWFMPFARRLMRLRLAAKRMAGGDFFTRVEVGPGVYLKDIEEEFNAMAAQIQLLMQDIKLLSGGLSHELRTPLARIRMGLDTLVGCDDEVLREKYSDKINGNLDSMEQLVEQMLKYTRLEHALSHSEIEQVEIFAVLKHMADNKTFAPDLTLHPFQASVFVSANEHYLTLALENIIQNAGKFATSAIDVVIEVRSHTVFIIIEDDGPGIPEEKRPDVLQPFIRLQNKETNGFGIGLAFSSRVIRHYGGTINIESGQVLCGARFVVSLPLPQ